MIHLEKVSKLYPGKRQVAALADVSLSIRKGETVAIVGPSGSGKSTLLNLIGGLDRPTSGEVTIDGTPLSEASDDERTRIRRDKIGFIFQFFNLLPTLTGIENVALPLHLRGWSRKDARARAVELLELVGLKHRLEHQPDELSGGERQRVAIARALSIYPPVLLGDEPTGNLDSATGREVLELLLDLQKRFAMTVVIVTHDSSVADRCDRTITIRDGRIIADLRADAAQPNSESPLTASSFVNEDRAR